jgi:hypothetical protein
VAYTKTTWVNDSPPDINAENLNKMEQGIADAQFPEGGTTGQVLKKTENGIAWGDDQAGTDAVWGNITGNMADQTDLNNKFSELNDNLSQKVSSVNSETPDTNGNVEISASDIPATGMGTKEASGNPIEIEDGVASNVLGLSVDIEPIQSGSGDPSPTNIRPITGRTQVDVTRTGHNVWDEEWEAGTINSITGEPSEQSEWIRSKNFIQVLPSTSYYFKHPTINFGIRWYRKDHSYIGYVPATTVSGLSTTPDDCWFAKFSVNTATYNHGISINYPATFTDYEPYQGQSVTVQLGQTVYGGTLDVNTGKLTVTHTCADMGDMDWIYEASMYRFYSTSVSNVIKKAILETISQIRCSALKTSAAPLNSETVNDHTICSYVNGVVYARSLEYTSGDDFKSAYTGQKIWYELETPIKLTITPAQLALLEGYNILTTDGDTINLRYISTEASNVQAEIDEFEESTRKLAGSLAMVETSPATANHAVEDLIVYNNQLYKVTVAIASGEAIVVGTNVQSTTIADELKAILTQLSA